MAEFAFVKAECESVDVKEEYVEEEDPLMMTSNSENRNTDKGDYQRRR